ncbi:MAG: sulfatase-like hydrolase/transferase, partial [Niameybacter sp.]
YYVPVTAAHLDTLEGKPEHHKVWAGVNEKTGKRTPEQIVETTNNGKGSRQDIFFGCNTFVDDEMGRVMEAIDDYAPDALVIYTSDHGTFFGEHGLREKGPAMYDEITNIPLIMRCKAFQKQGIVDGAPVSHVDIAPTVFDMMGVPIPKMFVGNSLKEQITEGNRANDYIFMEFGRFEVDHDGFGGVQLVRATFDGRYKLVINLLTSDELYDLEADPYEVNNLIEDEAYEEIRNRLHDALLEEMNTSRDPFRGYYWERRPWRVNARKVTWAYTGMTRQKQNEEYEPKQLDYSTGLEMTEAVRCK